MKLGSVNVLLIAFLSQSYAQRNEIKRDAMERQLDQIHSDIDSGMEKYFEAKENEHFKVMENAQMKVDEAIVRLRDLGQDEEAEALAEEIRRVFDEDNEDTQVDVDKLEIKRDAMERQLDQIHSDIDSGMEKYFEAKENEHVEDLENAQMEVGEAIVRLRDLGQDEEAEALAEEIGRVFNEEEFVERVVNEDEDEDSEVGVDEYSEEYINEHEVPQGGVDEYEDSQEDFDESDNRQVDELDVDEIHYAIQENIDTYQHAKEDGEPEAMEDAKTSVEYGLEALKSLGHTEEAYQYEEGLKEIFE